jgi:hypothetical protein
MFIVGYFQPILIPSPIASKKIENYLFQQSFVADYYLVFLFFLPTVVNSTLINSPIDK